MRRGFHGLRDACQNGKINNDWDEGRGTEVDLCSLYAPHNNNLRGGSPLKS